MAMEGEATTADGPNPEAPRWAESVPSRPLGLGPDSQVVAFDGPEGAPATLLVNRRGHPGARLYRPTGAAEGGPTYDAGTPVDRLTGLVAPTAFVPPGSDQLALVGLDSTFGLVWVRLAENTDPSGGREIQTHYEPLGLPADLGLGPVRIDQMAAVDWDGDGKLDLLVGLDELTDYWPDGDIYPVEQQVGFDEAGGHPGYDEDGRWRGNPPRGRVVWLRNISEPGDEKPRFAPPEEIDADGRPLDVGLHPAPLLVSWGVAGNAEFLLSDDRNKVRLASGFGGMLPPAVSGGRLIQGPGGGPLSLPDERVHLAAADLNGDGKSVLLGGLADGRVFAVRPAGRDRAHAPQILRQAPGEFWVGGHAVVAVGDLDGDGGVDLVVGDGPGRLHWYREVGPGGGDLRYEAPRELVAGGDPFRLDPGVDGRLEGPISPKLGYACPTLVDWTGNGRPDLIVGGAGGEVILLRNDGAAFDPRFALPVGMRCAGRPLVTPPRVRPACGPWGPAGAMHLFALDLQGFLCAYRQRDPNTLEPPVRLTDSLGRWVRLDGGFGLAGHVSLWAGPWTGPDRTDFLVGFSRGTGRYLIPLLTGHDVDASGAFLLLEDGGPDGLIPRALRRANGPFDSGLRTANPSGVPTRSDGKLDLLVGSDAGHVHLIRREDLRW